MIADTLLETARPIVDRRARRYHLAASDRDDLLQDVVVKYLSVFADDAPRNLAAWVEVATARLLVDRYRGAERRPQDALPEHGEPHAIESLVAAWREATSTSLGALKGGMVAETLGFLSDADREVFERRYLHGEPASTIADNLGVAVNTVDQRAGRARKRLREALALRPDLVADLAAPHPCLY